MNNIINIFKQDEINITDDIAKLLKLEELGLLQYFKLINNNVELSELLKTYNLDINKFKELLQSLEKKQIIELEIDVKEQQKVYWNISFVSKQINNEQPNGSYSELFNLTLKQEQNLKLIEDQKELFLRLYNMYKNDIQSYTPDEIVIETMEQYTQTLMQINPLTFMMSLGVKPDVKDIYIIFEYMYMKNMKKEVVNFLIDYTISTSIYKNLSINFFDKVGQNWINNNIVTLQDAMKYVKDKKEEQKQKSNSKYVDPDWEEVESLENKDQDYNKLKEIEEMIKGNV